MRRKEGVILTGVIAVTGATSLVYALFTFPPFAAFSVAFFLLAKLSWELSWRPAK